MCFALCLKSLVVNDDSRSSLIVSGNLVYTAIHNVRKAYHMLSVSFDLIKIAF